MSEGSEISGLVISTNEAVGKLKYILADSIILKMNFTVATLGVDLEELMEFSPNEITGQLFETICVDNNLQKKVEIGLGSGSFMDLPGRLWTKSRETLHVTISGFYLGLISDINGYIILKVRLTEDNSFLKKELFTKKRELDLFIYRTAHDLRGPLATIMGLVNLLKMRKSNSEVDELTKLIEVHANMLDDRLFKLAYLAEDNTAPGDDNGCLNFPELRSTLEKVLDDNCQLDKVSFHFDAPTNDLCGINDRSVSQLIRNIFLYIISLPVASVARENEIIISSEFSVLNNSLNVSIKASGFIMSEKVQEAIARPTSLYNDLLSYPYLFNYYVARKEAAQLNAVYRIDFSSEIEQLLQLSIPIIVIP